MSAKRPLYQDPDYVQGQIESIRAMILGLARIASTSMEFREVSLEQLELLRTALMAEPVSETRLAAVDEAEAWIRRQTA